MGGPGDLVTMTMIAERSGVGVGAVSNWRKRHSTFPAPSSDTGVEWFDAAAIAAWLGTRKIPRNALRPDEEAGITYADRFLGGDRTDRSEARARDNGLDRIWSVLDSARGDFAAERYDELVLGLLWLRLREPRHWLSLLTAKSTSALLDQLRSLPLRLPRRAIPLFADLGLDAIGSTAFVRLVKAVEDIPLRLLSEEGRLYEIVPELLDRMSVALARRGDHYTPSSLCRLMVSLLDPQPNVRIHDPFCRAGELLLEAAAHARRSGLDSTSLRLSGDAVSERFLRLSVLATELTGLDVDLNVRNVLDVPRDQGGHADLVLANPPFNLRSELAAVRAGDARWRYGVPPIGNTNFAWLQHILWSLVPDGRAAVLMPNIATFSSHPAESQIRAAMVAEGAIEAVITLPDRLFPSTGIAVSLWVLRRPGSGSSSEDLLFVDASGLGAVPRRGQRVLREDDLAQIICQYRRWRERRPGKGFPAVPGLSASVARNAVDPDRADLNPRVHVTPNASALDVVAMATRIRDLCHERSAVLAHLSTLQAAVEEQLGSVVLEPGEGTPSPRRQVPLVEVCDLLAGPGRTETDKKDVAVPVVVPRNIRHGGLTADVFTAVPAAVADKMVRYRLRPGDVVGVRTGELGRFGVVGPDKSAWLLGPGCLRLRPRSEVDSYFLAHLLNSSHVRDWIDRRAAGSAIRAISSRALGNLPLELPPLAEQIRIAAVLRTLDAEADTHEQVSALSAGLRHVLREMLTTGAAIVGRW